MVDLEILLQKVTVGLLLYGVDGKIVKFNQALLDIIGYDENELEGVNYWDIVPQAFIESEKRKLEALKGDCGPFEKQLIHKKGHLVDVQLTKTLIEGSDNETYIWSTIENITPSKNAERVLNKAQEMANIGHWHLDLLKNELSWSDETYRIFGLEPQEFAATYEAFVERIYPDDRDKVNNAYTRSLEVDEAYQVEHRVIRPDQTIRYVIERCEHNHDTQGNIIGSIGTVIDVTEDQEKTKELYRAKEAAEAANVTKSSFIASISHELRTPLNAILGFTKKMLMDPELSQKNIQYLDIVNNSGEHLLAIINEILDISKIEAGSMDVELNPMDLYLLFNDSSDLLRGKSDEKGLDFSVEIDPLVPRYVICDEGKLRQIILNLAGNAIKFTDKGFIKIEVSSKPCDENPLKTSLSIVVEDSGPGIPKSMHKRIFEPFIQHDGIKKVEGGTGLGLAITKKLLALLGGTIKLQSSEGEGSKFSVTLDVEKSGPLSSLSLESSQDIIGIEETDKKRILIVDDILTNRMLVKVMFEDLGFEIKDAKSGEEALEIFRSWPADFIWMDIEMKGMNGYDVAALIRQEPKGDEVKIAAMTASLLSEAQKRFEDSECDYFVAKPFQKRELYDVVAHALGINYIYAKSDADKQQRSFDPQMLTKIPKEHMNTIIVAAEKSSGLKVKKALEAIKNDHPEVYSYLKGLVSQYDFDTILALLKDNYA